MKMDNQATGQKTCLNYLEPNRALLQHVHTFDTIYYPSDQQEGTLSTSLPDKPNIQSFISYIKSIYPTGSVYITTAMAPPSYLCSTSTKQLDIQNSYGINFFML